jgi:hypothetical protein
MSDRDHIWLLWEWTEDASLVQSLLSRALLSGLRVKAFTPAEFVNFDPTSLLGHPPVILWDRAGDVYPEALRISDWAEALGSRVINPVRGTLLARDKASLHELLVRHNLPVPSSRLFRADSPIEELVWGCGRYLVLKPERSGGGEGVRIQEWSEETLRSSMNSRPQETWLLQEHVEPAVIAGRRAWFRVFHLFGDIRICWWDNRTHIYDFLPECEVNTMGFNDLEMLGMKIGACFPMQFFSTEIVYREDGKPVIVDYLNDPCDLRSKTDVYDGVPAELLDWVFWKLFSTAREAVV